jgi:hypothetical protein
MKRLLSMRRSLVAFVLVIPGRPLTRGLVRMRVDAVLASVRRRNWTGTTDRLIAGTTNRLIAGTTFRTGGESIEEKARPA